MAVAARLNEFGQPIGAAIDWVAPDPPSDDLVLVGQYVTLAPLRPEEHCPGLFAELEGNPAGWTYLPQGPCSTEAELQEVLRIAVKESDRKFFVVIRNTDQKFVGFLCLLRINPAHGSIEIGYVHFGPGLQRTTGATEAIYLLIQWSFQSGYRRCEWKCDSLNAASQRSALRFGFTFEGIHRQCLIYKGRTRDTAWFSILEHEWPPIQRAFELWLAPENFDEKGMQRSSLVDLRSGQLA